MIIAKPFLKIGKWIKQTIPGLFLTRVKLSFLIERQVMASKAIWLGRLHYCFVFEFREKNK